MHSINNMDVIGISALTVHRPCLLCHINLVKMIGKQLVPNIKKYKRHLSITNQKTRARERERERDRENHLPYLHRTCQAM